MTQPSESGRAGERLMRVSAGAMSPLWLPFMFAASVGTAAWVASRWMRGEFAATLPLSPARSAAPTVGPTPPTVSDLMAVGAIDAPLPAAEPTGASAPIEPEAAIMAHVPPPADAGGAPADPAPPPPVEASQIMDHTPPETVDAGAPEPKLAPRISDAELGEEPGGRAGLLAETSASAIAGSIGFGGDVRAEDAAEGSAPAADTSADDDIGALADAAYAQNFGPVPVPAAMPARSRKRRSPPGTAPTV